MKSYNKLLLVLCGTFLFALGCKPDDLVGLKPSKNKNPFVWKFERERQGFYTNCFEFEDLLITGEQSSSGPNAGFALIALSLDSGKLVWRNENFPKSLNPFSHEEMLLQKGIIVVSQTKYIYAIDTRTGKELWRDEIDFGDYDICCIDNWVYKTTVEGRERSSLYRYQLQTGVREHVFSLDKNDPRFGQGFSPTLCMPALHKTPENKDLLIFHNRAFQWDQSMDRMDVIAFDLSADSVYWYRQALDVRAASARPVVDGNRIYFNGSYSTFCLDANSGETIWSESTGEDLYGDFNTANILMLDRQIIMKPDNYLMKAVDKVTGVVQWVNRKTAPSPYLLQARNDTIWFASGGIIAVDAKTGRKLIDWAPDYGWWSAPVTPSKQSTYVYTTDGQFIYCIDPQYLPAHDEP